MEYTLPSLPYQYGALEPYIDTLTMEIHHTKHHQAYINNLNSALCDFPETKKRPLVDLLADLSSVPEQIRVAVRNNGGGTFNHSMFWKLMKHDGGGNPIGKVGEEIAKAFQNFEQFQDIFNTAAKTVFGSGWAWLSVNGNGDLLVTTTANQDSPLSAGLTPIMGLDVWEHAYYLKYQNRRPDYIQAWWHVINWEQVEENYHEALKV